MKNNLFECTVTRELKTRANSLIERDGNMEKENE